jgi:hypothetical protein
VGIEDDSLVRNRSWRVQHNKIAGSYVNPQPWPLLGLHFVQLALHNTALSAGVKATNDNGHNTDPSSKPETDDFEHPETPLAYISRIGLVILSLKLLNDTFDRIDYIFFIDVFGDGAIFVVGSLGLLLFP